MNSQRIESVANAVLYEGYMLYPYRPSAVKNRQRWNFGVLYPKPYSELQKESDAYSMQTQCLIRGAESAFIGIRVRFLQCVARQIGIPAQDCPQGVESADTGMQLVESLEVDGRQLQSWQEAIDQAVDLPQIPLAELLAAPVHRTLRFEAAEEIEPVREVKEAIAAFIIRKRDELTCSIEVSAIQCAQNIFQLTVVVANATPAEPSEMVQREDALMKSLLSAHTLLGITGGEFLSLMDPPEDAREFASSCKNIGTWPVLAGDENDRDAMLSSPIILYDYPRIAPESPGDLFDGTEIDEILSLRILTLSDEEKSEIRRTDDRAREILERTEALPEEHLRKLHGAIRGMAPIDAPRDDIHSEDRR